MYVFLLTWGMVFSITFMSSPNTAGNPKGTTLYVGGTGSGNYTTIQSAVNDANSGDTIYVFDDNSPYSENLVINKQLILIGENRYTTIIIGTPAIQIYADYVEVKEFTIKTSGDKSDGIDLTYNHHNTITNCVFSNITYKSICLLSSSNNIIQNCDFKNNFNAIYIDTFSNYNQIIYNNIIDNINGGVDIYNPPPPHASRPSEYNFVMKNNFINNGLHARSSLTNYWNGSSEGNYWDDYTGLDGNGDGIGDTPYKIFPDDNQDNYPLMSQIIMNRPSPDETNNGTSDEDNETSNHDGDMNDTDIDDTPSNNDTDNGTSNPDSDTNETPPDNDTTNETDDVPSNNDTVTNDGKEEQKHFIPAFEGLLVVLCVNALLIKCGKTLQSKCNKRIKRGR